MKRKLVFRLLALGGSTLVCFVIIELAVRMFVPTGYWRFTDATDDWMEDPATGWVQTGDLHLTSSGAPPMDTNPDGLLPGNATCNRISAFRILLVGDSTCVGRAVTEESRIHHRLASQLRAQGLDVEVLNAGVQGYSTDQALLRLETLLPLYCPDIVLYAFCTNDFSGNAGPIAYGMGKPWFRLDEQGALTQMPFQMTPIPEQMGSGPKRWLQEIAIYRLCQPLLVQIRSSLGNWEQKALLDPEYFYLNSTACDEIDWDLFGALVERMRDSCRQHDCRFAFYAHPALEEVWEPVVRKAAQKSTEFDRYAIERRLIALSKQRGIRFCPMIQYFIQNQSQGPFHLLPRDPHCNATGYRLQAENLARYLVDNGFFDRDSSAVARPE